MLPLPDVKFLIVDDLEENLFACEQMLRREGLVMIRAGSGREALAALAVHDFALAIVDVQMPEMGGFELAEIMRSAERTRRIPIVFVTASLREPHGRFRGYEAGAVDFLYKPLEPVVLRNKAETFFELYRQRQMLEAANRAKDEFLANVTHEIRTPMNAILGLTELVLDTQLTEGQRQSLRTVRSAAGHLLGTINDVLDFSKIGAGKLALDHAPFELRESIGETMRALAVRAHRKGLELVCDIAPDVPDLLIGDAGRCRQVVINLVGNAIKFTERGEVVLEIGLAGGSDGSGAGRVGLRCAVRDTGIGISPAKQAAVFRAFEQEDASTTRRYGGTGLGLTIAAELIALMGGALELESQVGVGSVFTFTAWFGTPDVTADAQPRALHGVRVRVVETSAAARRALERWLRDWGVEVTSALPPQPPHPRTDSRYDLVLMDATLFAMGAPEGSVQLQKPIMPSELREALQRVVAGVPRVSEPVERVAAVTLGTPLLRILVAEDNEFNAQLLRMLLATRGHEVRVATTGREALELAMSDAYDLLLLDIHMPELDGFQVIRAIRSGEHGTDRHLPVIAVTARSRATDREGCMAAGVDDFIVKPISATHLWAAIDSVTSRRREPL